MKLGILAAAAAAMVSGAAGAVPIQWTVQSGGNGHYYDFVAGPLAWTAARTAALGASFNGQSGYLATVTSTGENDFLRTTFGGSGWLGGTDQAVEGTWIWVDGPEAGQVFWRNGATVTYAGWNNGEPNNAGDEDFLDFRTGFWNDLPGGSTLGYFVEYGGLNAGAVPEPATWAMMIAGFGLAGAAMRRRGGAPALA